MYFAVKTVNNRSRQSQPTPELVPHSPPKHDLSSPNSLTRHVTCPSYFAKIMRQSSTSTDHDYQSVIRGPTRTSSNHLLIRPSLLSMIPSLPCQSPSLAIRAFYLAES